MRERWQDPHPSRLAADHPRRAEILAAHAAALGAGDAGYPDPATGLFVLTAGFLARRGSCCGRGCRHCPFAGTPEGRAPEDRIPHVHPLRYPNGDDSDGSGLSS